MKKLIEIFGLGVLMILGGSLAEYTLSSFSVVFIYSGAFVLIWGLGLFYWKVIQKGMRWIKELKILQKNNNKAIENKESIAYFLFSSDICIILKAFVLEYQLR